MTALVLEGLQVDRGGFPIVRQIDLEVPAGEVSVLLGPNGAGKTTLLEAISGLIPAAAGTVRLGERNLTRASRRTRAAEGISHIEQGRTVFPSLTTEENLQVVGDGAGWDRALALFPELERRRTVSADRLSGGEQQMLVLARALANNPSIILVDELSLGLAPVIVKRLIPVVRRLADEGAGVLLVEQFAAEALGIGDKAYLLNQGELAYSGTAKELLDKPDLLHRAYLGVEQRAAGTASAVSGA
jgi:branched-chain amino acid transport system ATP-binding protein